MAAPKRPTAGETLRRAAEELLDCADGWDEPSSTTTHRQMLHDRVETALDHARIVVRGRGFA